MNIANRKLLIIKILLTFMVGLSSQTVFSQFESDTVFRSIATGQTLSLKIPPPPQLVYKLGSYKAYIKFSVGDIYKLGISGGTNFSVNIKYKIGVDAGYTSELTMDLDNGSPEKLYVYNIGAKPSDLNAINVLITEITIPSSIAANVSAYIRQNLQASVAYRPEYKIDIRETESGPVLAPAINSLASGIIIKNRVQTFSWDHSETKEFPNYEFQLLRLYNISESTIADPQIITTEIDWNRALRIETESAAKTLTLTVAEGSGYYIWRVRPIGNYYDGGITDRRNYGAWSDAPTEDTLQVTRSLASLYKCIFFLDDPEDSINWTYSRVFTEQNRVSEAMTYANGLYQVKQTQRFLPSKDTTLVSQTVMDYSGRPALQTLPAPAKGGISLYRKGFVKANDSLYTARHFDDSTSYRNPSPVDSSGFFEYYSDSNKDLFIPSSQGYSYSRTLYENAPQGRAIEQSGAGKVHAIGKQTDGKGRTLRMIYCKPSDEELIRIFGDEALPASAVLKTITIDPNNTSSVTYTSTNGKVIATCLVYNNEDAANLKSISGYEDQDLSKTTFTEEIRGNFKTIDGFISEKSIILSYPSKLKIKYNIPHPSATFGCTRIDADCEYVVNLSISKAGTDSVWNSGDIVLKGVKLKDTTWIPQTQEFSKGTYIIRKEIHSEANRLHPKVYGRIDASLDPVKNIGDIIYGWLSKIKTDRQMLMFYEDVQKFADLLNVKDYNGIRNYKFKLGSISLHDTAYSLQTTEGRNYITIDVSPSYSKDSTDYPKMISILGGCCGPVVIPVLIQPQTICYTAEELRNNPSLTPDFWGYLRKIIIEPFGSSMNLSLNNSPGKKNIIRGYDSIALNKMIYYMLTDAYYTGPTITLNGKTVKPDSTEITAIDKKEQYTCNELWNCWKSVVNSYADIMKNNYTKGVGSVDKAMKDDQKEEGKNSPKDEHFDKEGKKFGGFFLKYVLGIDLSKKMKQAEHINLDDTTSTGDSVRFEFKLVEQFLNCAGYRFAGIVEKKSDGSLKGILDEDKVKDFSYTNSKYYYESPDFIFSKDPAVGFPKDSLVLPYIKNPMYAFKYFQYDGDTLILRSKCRKWLDVEVATCFEDNSDKNLCENKCGKRTHFDWTAYERYMFYSTLKSKKEPEDGTSTPAIPTATVNMDSIAKATFDELRATCPSICNKRRDDIDKLVRQAFEDNCYVLNGCPADSNVVLENDIREIVNSLIDHCISDCDTLFAKAKILSYPKVTYPQCLRVNQRGTGWQTVTGEPFLTIMPEESKHTYDVFDTWKFRFALDDKYSRCKVGDNFTGSLVSPNWLVVDKDGWDLSQVYTANTLVMTSSGSTRTKALYLLRNDVADNFDLSVKVDSFITTSDSAISGIIALINENSLDSAFVQIGITAHNRLYLSTDTVGKYISGTTITYPCYLRLERKGNQFIGYYRNSISSLWTSFGQVTVALPYNPVVGLFTSSAVGINTVKVVFDDFDGGKKLPNKLNDNVNWIHNAESSYPVYDSQGFPKKYTEAFKNDITIKP